MFFFVCVVNHCDPVGPCKILVPCGRYSADQELRSFNQHLLNLGEKTR